MSLAQKSEYVIPIFIMPNKDGNLELIMGYHRINKQRVRNEFPITIIDKTIQQPEVLKYIIALDTKMGYYTIYILHQSK